MKDHDQYRPAQMLKEIQEQEDSHYPVNTTPKPHSQDNHNKNMTHYVGKSSPYDKNRTYAIRHTNVQLLDPEQDEPNTPPTCEFDTGEVYNEGYYVAVIAMADKVDQWGCCFNCGKEGNHWAECTEPLKDSLKWAKEWANHKKQSLNQDRGAGMKGTQPPKWGWPRSI